MKKLFRNILNQFLGHTTDGYFRVPDTAQDLPNPKNDTPWAGTLKLSMDKFNKLTRKDGLEDNNSLFLTMSNFH